MKLATILLIILIPALISGSDFIPDPVFEHIKKHGPGIDVVSTKGKDKPKNKQLKQKNFKPGSCLWPCCTETRPGIGLLNG